MRITMLTVGSRGDIQPLVALGEGLTASGHDVRLATHPRFEPMAVAHGLAFAPLAEGLVSRGAETAAGRRWIESHSRGLPALVGFVRDARSVARLRLRQAAAACADSDALVASNLALLLGWQMAELRGVPLVRAFIEPPLWMLGRRPLRQAAPALRQLAWLIARPWLHRVRGAVPELGLGTLPLRDPIAQLDRRGAPALYGFSPAVLAPAGGLPPGAEETGYWFLERPDEREPDPELVEFLDGGKPVVSVGFSTMIDTDRARTTALVVEALRRVGARGVLLGAADAPATRRPSPEVLAVEEVSHDWLFPRCAAVVHHAAAGTTAAGVRAGVPAVAVPHMTDQFVAYPVIFAAVTKADPRALPALYRAAHAVSRLVITPGLAVVILCGIYLASKLEVWSSFYVQWGLAVAIVIGGIEGALLAPTERRLIEQTDRDVAAAGEGPVVLSAEHDALFRRVGLIGALMDVLVVMTIFFMVARTGG